RAGAGSEQAAVDALQFALVFAEKGLALLPHAVRKRAVRAHGVERAVGAALIEQRAGDARRAADVYLVGIVEDLRLDALRRVALAEAVRAHAVGHAGGEVLV